MMKVLVENHFVSDSNCNLVNVHGMKNTIKFTSSIGDTTHRVLQLVLSKTDRIGDTKYDI